MPGRMPISEINDILYTSLPVEEAHTIGGFVVNRLRRLPKEGDIVEGKGYRVTVLEADSRVAVKVRLEQI
jgi:CBS domain containing-hemolysin-like protein